jgi:hypothetical protein
MYIYIYCTVWWKEFGTHIPFVLMLVLKHHAINAYGSKAAHSHPHLLNGSVWLPAAIGKDEKAG